MIPSKYQREQEPKPKQQFLKKVSNLFLMNGIENNNLSVLKTILYISKTFNLSNYDLNKYKNKQLITFKIDFDNITKETNLNKKTIRNNLDNFQDTKITFFENDILESYVLIPKYTINYNKNLIEIDIYTKIVKLILQVKNNYSFININELLKLNNKHSIRMLGLLYYIFNFGKNIPKRTTLTLQDLNQFFGTNYKTFGEIKRKLLEPIKNELDSNTFLTFTYTPNYKPKGKGRPIFDNVVIDLIQRDYVQKSLLN